MGKNLLQQTEELLDSMDTISLEEMDHVVLMRRTDTKYVLPSDQVPELLKEVSGSYRVLNIQDLKMQEYQTVYYDTPDFSMYHHHHNQRLNRYKIRVREYVSSGITFLEVKFKNNKRETIKKRIKPGETPLTMVNGFKDFLEKNSPYSPEELQPALENSFIRITLVHREIPERITIDLNLIYKRTDQEKNIRLPGVSIIEVKRNRDSNHSDMVKALHYRHIQPMGFSKYCMGTALTQDSVKKNLFRKRLRQLSKMDENFKILQN